MIREQKPLTPSPLLQRHGAVAADGADAAVAGHYGDPLREQRQLARATPEHPVAVDLSHLGVVTVRGADRASWLTTLSSQVLAGLPEGASTELVLLSAQGRMEYAPHVVIGREAVWLIVEPGQAEPLTAFLESMRFMLRVEVADASADYAVVGTRTDPREGLLPVDLEVPGEPGPPIWRDPWPGVVEGGTSYSSAPDHPGARRSWYEAVVPREALTRLPAQWAGLWAAEALRIEEWRPRALLEADEKAIPHELDLMRTAVHLAKGCYKGQETVARVHNLGHPPRRLVFLDIDGSEHTLPTVGSQIFAEGGNRPVGRVTSVALHHEAGPIGLGVIKRSVDPAASLRIVDRVEMSNQASSDQAEGTGQDESVAVEYAAAQTVIVDPEAGQVAGRRRREDFFR